MDAATPHLAPSPGHRGVTWETPEFQNAGASPGNQLIDLKSDPQHKLHPDSELCPGLPYDHKMIGTGQLLPPYL